MGTYVLELECSACKKTQTMVVLSDEEKTQIEKNLPKSQCCEARLIYIRAIDIKSLIGSECCGGKCHC